ncbi:hypothetical protein R1sor_020158 [Riccia sorocarpa]|uniref:Replitron HUH endonuclease domain-containing protein n=1 Tax=Riccia sorocarpa TaxID=122646 RepID=A0ABD3IFP8_9MARC
MIKILYGEELPVYPKERLRRCAGSEKNLNFAEWKRYEERVDYYALEPTFVDVEWLTKQQVSSIGPFIFCSQNEKYVELEDANGRLFIHWKWTCRRRAGEWEYRSTAVAVWSSKCCCSSAYKNTGIPNNLPSVCLCRELLQREYCHICLARESSCKKRLQRTAESTDSADPNLEQTLSQDTCLCSTVFNTNEKCYYGFGESAKRKRVQTSCEEGEAQADGRSSPEKDSQDPGETSSKKTPKLSCCSRATVGLIALERGDATLQLHIQGVLALLSTSTKAIKEDILKAIGWKNDCPLGGAICVKALTNKGVHTLVGMVGYCTKDEQELHYEMYSVNVTA